MIISKCGKERERGWGERENKIPDILKLEHTNVYIKF